MNVETITHTVVLDAPSDKLCVGEAFSFLDSVSKDGENIDIDVFTYYPLSGVLVYDYGELPPGEYVVVVCVREE